MTVVRTRDPGRTRAEILDVATREFSEQGFAGARVDEIAASTRTTKRMIYYYFGSKEGLYVAVLENAYSRIRDLEQELDVDHLEPVDALRRLAELTFDHHEAHPEFIRLVSIENIHRAQFLRRTNVAGLTSNRLQVLETILARGRAQGLFRADVSALDVHQAISAQCVFRTANRHTFDALFGRDTLDPSRREHDRRLLGDMVVALLTVR
ncbi:TetR/AcrR family transcriptional regulator [Kineococcus rhizosphaerae]|uniref:TetR family transcriptional regulator n=1 Tax=Kineococcus rhizosphaerae TaxID=559628 RepID=A0A2T0R3J0_9ACTN|nr:TetR/AcrR family transcriptional regulator [Kineococcus rhizosphaerae]PRY14629.1 TetR family transcriptional regulator [Kineococcus rhizosphaerae]